MITKELNNLINEASAYSNYSTSWSPTTSSSKDVYEGKYNSTTLNDWINTYINTTTTSPDGITWTSPYVSTSTSSISTDIQILENQVNDLCAKNSRLENDVAMLKCEKEQLKTKNDDLNKRLNQLEAIVRTFIAGIEE